MLDTFKLLFIAVNSSSDKTNDTNSVTVLNTIRGRTLGVSQTIATSSFPQVPPMVTEKESNCLHTQNIKA
jgi:hypothetical protein